MSTIKCAFLSALLILLGCAPTTPEQRAADEKRRMADQKAEDEHHEAEEQRHAADERRHAEDELRHKYQRYSTGELKLMDARYRDLTHASGRELDVTLNKPRWVKGADAANTERVLEIERELLRRWKAGDNEAYLPEFESTRRDVIEK